MKTVRNGQMVWPFCTRCGCRLEMVIGSDDQVYFRHYDIYRALFGEPQVSAIYVDARGCMCVDDIWALEDRIIYQGIV